MGNVIKPEGAQEAQLKANFSSNCQKAARAIHEANIFLFAAGAGFSSDSNIPIFRDIAEVPAYKERGLTYRDLAVPSWFSTDPELAYGFVGNMFNLYKSATPHEGYFILKDWRDKYFSKVPSYWTEQWNKKNSELLKLANDSSKYRKPTIYFPEEAASITPGPFFIFTSNVDSFFHTTGFKQHEIREVHGSVYLWQCHKPCVQKLWRAPPTFEFEINENMLAPSHKSKVSGFPGFETNHPTCIYCGEKSRPNVLLFDDTQWICDRVVLETYMTWETVVWNLLEDNILVNKKPIKMVIVEVGAGDRVRTVRKECEKYLFKWKEKDVTVVRINPEFPLADHPEFSNKVIPIMSGGLEALKEIDKFLKCPEEKI